MKNRIVLVVLVLICFGLIIAFISVNRDATKQRAEDSDRISTFSNKWVSTSGQLDEQKQVAAMLEKDVDAQKKNLGDVSNKLVEVTGSLTQTEASLAAAKKEIAARDTKIAELETQNQALDKQAGELSTAITNLTFQIADTQKKLATSEGNKAFLEKELQRLIAEKADLERQFNDLTVLRAQVAKLKEELSIARRLDWIRNGLFASSDQTGAQKLMQGINPTATAQAKASKPNYDLNVEVTSDGSVRVIPPSTNAPVAK
jgi:chromosome segregation ATPase